MIFIAKYMLILSKLITVIKVLINGSSITPSNKVTWSNNFFSLQINIIFWSLLFYDFFFISALNKFFWHKSYTKLKITFIWNILDNLWFFIFIVNVFTLPKSANMIIRIEFMFRVFLSYFQGSFIIISWVSWFIS